MKSKFYTRTKSHRRILALLLCAGVLLLGIMFIGCSSIVRIETTGSAVPQRVGILYDKELVVVYVEPDSPAAAGGILVGDKLLRLDNLDLSKGAQARRATNRVRAEQAEKVVLTILRDNKEMQIEVDPAPWKGVVGGPTATPAPPDLTYF